MSRSHRDSEHQTTSNAGQAPKPLESMNSSLRFTNIIEYVTSQPGLADTLNEKYYEMGLGRNISTAVERVAKRGIEAVTDAQRSPQPKKSKSEKPSEAGREEMNPENKDSTVDKVLKEQRKLACISCREEYSISQFPRRLPSLFCSHGREMCQYCTIEWIRVQGQGGIIPRCALCYHIMSYAFVESTTGRKCDEDVFIG